MHVSMGLARGSLQLMSYHKLVTAHVHRSDRNNFINDCVDTDTDSFK